MTIVVKMISKTISKIQIYSFKKNKKVQSEKKVLMLKWTI